MTAPTATSTAITRPFNSRNPPPLSNHPSRATFTSYPPLTHGHPTTPSLTPADMASQGDTGSTAGPARHARLTSLPFAARSAHPNRAATSAISRPSMALARVISAKTEASLSNCDRRGIAYPIRGPRPAVVRRHFGGRGGLGELARPEHDHPCLEGRSITTLRNGPRQDGVPSPCVAGITGAGRSWTAWTISVLSIPRRYTDVIARSA